MFVFTLVKLILIITVNLILKYVNHQDCFAVEIKFIEFTRDLEQSK